MRALVKQVPSAQAEVFFETSWLAWMDPETGYPLNTFPYCYGLCMDARSDDPADYAVVEHEQEGGETAYTAEMRA